MRPAIAPNPSEPKSPKSACWKVSSHVGLDVLRFGSGFLSDQGPGDGVTHVTTGQALLSGHVEDVISLANATHKTRDCLEYIENETFLVGVAQLATDPSSLEQNSHRIYRSILKVTGNRSLYRIWNYVPGINHEPSGGIENYKRFCSGRALAFAESYGDGDTTHFPSASATGCKNGQLTVVFIAGNAVASHWENPNQVPAYRYPRKYGPRSPSFARASRFSDAHGGEWIFVAGTAAIKGSETLYPGDFSRQLPVTLENLNTILEQVGMQLEERGRNRRRHFKVFLRNRKNLMEMRAAMQGILGPVDTCSIVEGDVCRVDLDVEIELTIYPER